MFIEELNETGEEPSSVRDDIAGVLDKQNGLLKGSLRPRVQEVATKG